MPSKNFAKKRGTPSNNKTTHSKKARTTVRYKQSLLHEAKAAIATTGRIDKRVAKVLWKNACDGNGVTENEFATLQRILDQNPFTKGGRKYLDSLVTKHESGTSMYKKIKGIKYDRSCFDLAEHLEKDGKISLTDARLLWTDVLDGPGVTHIEKQTLEYIMANLKVTSGAKQFLKLKLSTTTLVGQASARPVRPSSSAPSSSSSSSSSSVSISSPALLSLANHAAAPRVVASTPAFIFAPAPATGGWHFGGFGSSDPTIPKKFEFKMGAKAYGLCVSDTHCFAADESGSVFQLDLDGKLVKQFALPDGVKCLVADHGFIFAGCNNGSLYDLTVSPRLVAELEDFKQILWLDIYNGIMAASDETGHVALVNCEGETLWKKKSSGEDGWMVRVDETGIYHGHSKGVTKYSMSGNVLWNTRTEAVLFGWQEGSHIYAGLVEPNAFSGEIAKRLRRAGAKCGQVVVSLMWDNSDDLDLHVHTPSGEHIYYGHKKSSCGGELDVDMNAGSHTSTEPVENIYWKKGPAGTYRVSVINFRNKSNDMVTPYEVHIKILDQTTKYTGEFKNAGMLAREEHIVHTFNFEETALRPEDNLPQKCIVCLDKATGALVRKYATNSSVPSTACSPDEKLVFAAVPNAVQAFDGDKGTSPRWNLKTGTGNAMTMQYASGDRLYFVAADKVVCADISETSVKQALEGKTFSFASLARDDRSAPAVTAPVGNSDLKVATDTSSGVIVKCVKQGSKVRVRPEPGQGFDEHKNIQFPRNIRQDGARFLVDGLSLCGSFYRVQGDIRRL